MDLRIKNGERIAQIATISTLTLMVCWGAVLVLLPVKPFWRDEWCIIYNLKFKDAKMLWGPLDFTQQFPRVYLEVLKWFTSLLDYSYFSLRFPSFLISSTSVFFCWALMKKLYPQPNVTRYLFVLILVSHQVFMDYFVQIKHYEMEIFLSLAAIWQLLELLSIWEEGIKSKGLYLVLCLSFLIAPFFSYTYPIAVTPIFIITFLQGRMTFKKEKEILKKKNLLPVLAPLCICLCSIAVFYFIDISQLMADKNMHEYWKFRMMDNGNILESIFVKMWRFFAKVGSGFVFEIVFGVIGIAAFIYALFQNIGNKYNYSKLGLAKLYCIILVAVAIALFFAGKLPLGEPKFNAFTVPAISILIISFLDRMQETSRLGKIAKILSGVLIIALIGNVAFGVINMFASDEYAKRLHIYAATERAIKLAHDRKIPLFITPAVGYPDDITAKILFISMPTAAGILKTFPAYEVADTIAIYDIKDYTQIQEYKKKLPAGIIKVLEGDGLTYKFVNW